MQRFTYPVTLTPDPAGGFVVSSRDIPELVTQGETPNHAVEQAEGALQAAIEMRIDDGLAIPAPTALEVGEQAASLPVSTAMKAALHMAMREQGVTKSELARRLNLDEKEARRILDPRHATKVPAIERALRALGKRVELAVV